VGEIPRIGEIEHLARHGADLLLTYPWKLRFWGDSIGLGSLLDTAALTGDARYSGFVHGLLTGGA